MPKRRVHLCRNAHKAVTAVGEGEHAEVLVDLEPSPYFDAPIDCQRPYTLHLEPADARKLALQLMTEAQEAADWERRKKSP